MRKFSKEEKKKIINVLIGSEPKNGIREEISSRGLDPDNIISTIYKDLTEDASFFRQIVVEKWQ